MFNQTQYFVKEHVGILKLTDTYDIFDPASGRQIGVAKEKVPGLMQLLRLLVNKRMLPTSVEIKETPESPPHLTIKRGFTLLQSKITVHAADGRMIGYFKSKLFSFGGGFHVFDAANRQVADVKGNWKGWDFKMLASDGGEMGTVTKKWAGLGKELFTSADNYMIDISPDYEGNETVVALLLAAGLAIDIVFKEK